MTVMVCYGASPVRLPGGRGGVHITRKADIGGGEKDPVRDWRNISSVGILLTAEDALALVRAYREDRDGRFEDVSGDGQEVSLEFVLGIPLAVLVQGAEAHRGRPGNRL